MARTLVNTPPLTRSHPLPSELLAQQPAEAEQPAAAPEVYWGDRLAVYVWMISAGILAALLGVVTLTDLIR